MLRLETTRLIIMILFLLGNCTTSFAHNFTLSEYAHYIGILEKSSTALHLIYELKFHNDIDQLKQAIRYYNSLVNDNALIESLQELKDFYKLLHEYRNSNIRLEDTLLLSDNALLNVSLNEIVNKDQTLFSMYNAFLQVLEYSPSEKQIYAEVFADLLNEVDKYYATAFHLPYTNNSFSHNMTMDNRMDNLMNINKSNHPTIVNTTSYIYSKNLLNAANEFFMSNIYSKEHDNNVEIIRTALDTLTVDINNKKPSFEITGIIHGSVHPKIINRIEQ